MNKEKEIKTKIIVTRKTRVHTCLNDIPVWKDVNFVKVEYLACSNDYDNRMWTQDIDEADVYTNADYAKWALEFWNVEDDVEFLEIECYAVYNLCIDGDHWLEAYKDNSDGYSVGVTTDSLRALDFKSFREAMETLSRVQTLEWQFAIEKNWRVLIEEKENRGAVK